MVLVVVSFFKELFGSGKLFGMEIFGNATEATGLYSFGYMDNGLMLLPPSSLILVAIYIWIQKIRNPSYYRQIHQMILFMLTMFVEP